MLIMQRGKVVAFGTIAEILNARPDLQSRKLEDVFLALIGQEEAAEA
jgi:hypothetical protein